MTAVPPWTTQDSNKILAGLQTRFKKHGFNIVREEHALESQEAFDKTIMFKFWFENDFHIDIEFSIHGLTKVPYSGNICFVEGWSSNVDALYLSGVNKVYFLEFTHPATLDVILDEVTNTINDVYNRAMLAITKEIDDGARDMRDAKRKNREWMLNTATSTLKKLIKARNVFAKLKN